MVLQVPIAEAWKINTSTCAKNTSIIIVDSIFDLQQYIEKYVRTYVRTYQVQRSTFGTNDMTYRYIHGTTNLEE